jgi:hypothetical protein
MLDQEAQLIWVYEGRSPEELRRVIQSGHRKEEAAPTWEEQPVSAEWEDSWRAANVPIRGGRHEEEEAEDDSEESEEEDTDPENPSIEETRALISELEMEVREFDRAATRYGNEAIRLQAQLDRLREQRGRTDTPELREEMDDTQLRMWEITAKLRRNCRRRTRLEE